MRCFAEALVRRRRSKKRFACCVALAMTLAMPWLSPNSYGGDAIGVTERLYAQSDQMPRGELFIETASGKRRFEIEIARTRQQQQRGLMFRTELAANAGMLFVYPLEHEIVMWMKNTLIPLDMLFIGSDGRITHIAERRTPLSEDHIFSRGPARSVLELRGGTVNLLRIKPGDLVRSEALETSS
jgi:hypothetical protein